MDNYLVQNRRCKRLCTSSSCNGIKNNPSARPTQWPGVITSACQNHVPGRTHPEAFRVGDKVWAALEEENTQRGHGEEVLEALSRSGIRVICVSQIRREDGRAWGGGGGPEKDIKKILFSSQTRTDQRKIRDKPIHLGSRTPRFYMKASILIWA